MKEKTPILALNDITEEEALALLKKLDGPADGKEKIPQRYVIIKKANDFSRAWENCVERVINTALFWGRHRWGKTDLSEIINKCRGPCLGRIHTAESFEKQQDIFYAFYESLVTDLSQATGIGRSDIKKALREAEKYQGIGPRANITTISRVKLGMAVEAKQLPGGKKSYVATDKEAYGFLIQREYPACPLTQEGITEYLKVAEWDGKPEGLSKLPLWFQKASADCRHHLRAALADFFEGCPAGQRKEWLKSIFFPCSVRIGPGISNLFKFDVRVVTAKGSILSSSGWQLRSAAFPSPDKLDEKVHQHICRHNLQRVTQLSDELHGKPILLYAATLLTPSRLVSGALRAPDYRLYKSKQKTIEQFMKGKHVCYGDDPTEYSTVTVDNINHYIKIIDVNHVYNRIGRKNLTGHHKLLKVDDRGEELETLAKRQLSIWQSELEQASRADPPDIDTIGDLSIRIPRLRRAAEHRQAIIKELKALGNYGVDGHLTLSNSESFLTGLLNGVTLIGCVEGKDRTTTSVIMIHAGYLEQGRIAYAEFYGIKPYHESAAENYAIVFATGHHRLVTGEHCVGVEGFKMFEYYLPPDYIAAIAKKLGDKFMSRCEVLAKTFNLKVIKSTASRVISDAKSEDMSAASHVDSDSESEDENMSEAKETPPQRRSRSNSRDAKTTPTRRSLSLSRALSDFLTPKKNKGQSSPSLASKQKEEGSEESEEGYISRSSSFVRRSPSSSRKNSADLAWLRSPSKGRSLSSKTILSRLSQAEKMDDKALPDSAGWVEVAQGAFQIPLADFQKAAENREVQIGEFVRNFRIAGKPLEKFMEKDAMKRPLAEGDNSIMAVLIEQLPGLAPFKQFFIGGSGIFAKLQSVFQALLPKLNPALTGAETAPFTAQIISNSPPKSTLEFLMTVYGRIPNGSSGPPNIIFETKCRVIHEGGDNFKVTRLEVMIRANHRDPELYAGLRNVKQYNVAVFSGHEDDENEQILAAIAMSAIREAAQEYGDVSQAWCTSELFNGRTQLEPPVVLRSQLQHYYEQESHYGGIDPEPQELKAVRSNIKTAISNAKGFFKEFIPRVLSLQHDKQDAKEKSPKSPKSPGLKSEMDSLRDLFSKLVVFGECDDAAISKLSDREVNDLLSDITRILMAENMCIWKEDQVFKIKEIDLPEFRQQARKDHAVLVRAVLTSKFKPYQEVSHALSAAAIPPVSESPAKPPIPVKEDHQEPGCALMM